jgi:hypothetical protein
MNAKMPHSLAVSSPSPAKRPATEREDLRKRLVRLIADREAAKHVARKDIGGK